MGKGRNISSESVAQMVAWNEMGMSQTAIATLLRLQQSVVSRCLKRYRETGSFSWLKTTGRPRVTTERTDNLIHRMSVADPTRSSTSIKSSLPDHVTVNRRTIQRRLQKDFNLKAHRPAKKPRLSPKNITDRLAFCRKYESWTVADWQKVTFTDESTVKQFNNYCNFVRRPVGQRYSPRYVIPTVKNCPSVMVWGSIGSHGRGALHIVPPNTTVTGTSYLALLQEKLPLWMPLGRYTVFQHDGAPAHTCKKVSQWLQPWLRDNGYTLLAPWPGNSPDLNIIENCWVDMKIKVAALKPTSKEDLVQKIKNVWTTLITPEYCASLVNSMPRRIQACLASGGQHTKY